jgi:hypothetical protein
VAAKLLELSRRPAGDELTFAAKHGRTLASHTYFSRCYIPLLHLDVIWNNIDRRLQEKYPHPTTFLGKDGSALSENNDDRDDGGRTRGTAKGFGLNRRLL